MADGRHFENRYIAISLWKIIGFSWNFLHSSRCLTGWTSRDQKWKKLYWTGSEFDRTYFLLFLLLLLLFITSKYRQTAKWLTRLSPCTSTSVPPKCPEALSLSSRLMKSRQNVWLTCKQEHRYKNKKLVRLPRQLNQVVCSADAEGESICLRQGVTGQSCFPE